MRNAIWALVLMSVGSAGTASAQTLDFALTNIPIPLPSSDIPCCVAVGDFNGDGKQDIALLGAGAFDASPPNEVLVLLGNGHGTFQKDAVYPVGIASRGLAVGDFNGDGKQDLAVANVSSNDVSVLLGNGDGTFQPAISVPAQGGTVNASDSGPSLVAVGDFNRDGKQDMAVLFPQSDQVGVLLGNGDGTFQPLVVYAVDKNPHWAAVADFNGDGKLDLVTANTRAGDLSVLLGNGDGTFRPAVNLPAGERPTRGVVGDFNRDGKLDVAILSTSVGTVNVMLGNGDGRFQAPHPYSTGGSPNSIVMADFDGDGKLDLAVDVNSSTTNVPSLAVLRGNGGGAFQLPIQLDKWVNPTKVFEMALGDFNNDGKPDLAVANYGTTGTATVSILLNTTGSGPQPTLTPNGVRSVANGAIPNPPGSLVYAQGTNLVSATTQIIASSTPLPTHLQNSLDDVSLTVNGTSAPMYYALPNYVSFQLPWETDISTGSATLMVTRNGVASTPLQFPVSRFSLGIYTTTGNGIGMAWAIFAVPSKINPKGQVAQATSVGPYLGVPATAGDLLYIYVAGLGLPKDQAKMVDGQAPCPLKNNVPGPCPTGFRPSDYSTNSTPMVMVGGVQAKVDASILDPTYPGLYLVYFEVPSVAPKGNAVSIQLRIPGGPSTDPTNVTIAIQ